MLIWAAVVKRELEVKLTLTQEVGEDIEFIIHNPNS